MRSWLPSWTGLLAMQDRERLDFTYTPPYWPRIVLLLTVLPPAVILLFLPLDTRFTGLLLLMLALLTIRQWRQLATSPVVRVIHDKAVWSVQLNGLHATLPVRLAAYSQWWHGRLVLQLDARPYQRRPLWIYLAESDTGSVVYRAVCRRLFANPEIRR